MWSYHTLEGSGLFVLFTQFPPMDNEFLIDLGNNESEVNQGWYVLTNQRLIQKDGRDKIFKEILLNDVDTFKIKGLWTKSINFKMMSGVTISSKKVRMYPPKKHLMEAIKQAKAT